MIIDTIRQLWAAQHAPPSWPGEVGTMLRNLLALFFIAVCSAGCSSGVVPISISGTVQTASGKPVTGVRLILEPTDGDKFAVVGFALDADGHFSGEALPGSYAFYLAPVSVERDDDDGHPVNAAESKKLKASNQVLKGIPAAYRTAKGATGNRIVAISAGANLTLTVTP